VLRLVRAVREETSVGEHVMQRCDRYIMKHRRKVVLGGLQVNS
jgi:hypothetical protein